MMNCSTDLANDVERDGTRSSDGAVG